MTNSFLSKYIKEWKDLPYNDYDLNRLFVYNDMRNLQANLLLIRYLLLPHPADSGGGEGGAGGRLQQEGGRDAGDRDGGAQGGQA